MEDKLLSTYLDHYNFIRQKVYQYWSKQSYIEFDDLLSEANIVFLVCYQQFDPSYNTSFKTYLSKSLDNRLMDCIYFEFRQRKVVLPENENHIDRYCIDFEDWKKSLSYNSQMIIDSLFEDEGIESEKSGKITKQSITKYLRNKGWLYTDIHSSFDEIKTALNNY